MLIGRIWSEKVIGTETLKQVIKAAWKFAKGVGIRRLANNTFLFKFSVRAEKRRVLENVSWLIRDQQLVLKEWDPDQMLDEVDFNSKFFWIRVMNITPRMISFENAKIIGEYWGGAVQYDKGLIEGDNWQTHIRVKVKIDIRKPLKP